MSITTMDGKSLKVSKLAIWFFSGFTLFSVVLNARGIAGFLHSLYQL